MSRLKLAPTILVKYILIYFYELFCTFCTRDNKKITFASYRSNKLKGNLYYVANEIEKEYPAFKQVLLLRKFDSSRLGKLTYIFHMIHSCYHLATSKYFIVDDYYLPLYMLKLKNDVQVIQLWHSAGALKKFGLSTVGKPYGPSESYLKHVKIHGNYSKAYVSANEVVPYFAEAFGMKEHSIYPLGVPRTDYFFTNEGLSEQRTKLYEIHPELAGKKLILYAPTYRGKSHDQDTFELPFDIIKMEATLSEEYALLIHLHPYMQAQLKQSVHSGFAYPITNTFTIEELLVLTDILITDYSTVFFDFSLLGKSIIFYAYDLEEYKEERDFYYDYEALVPGPVAKNTEKLIELITEDDFDLARVKEFSQRFFDHQDGRATERVVRDIMEG